MPEDEVAKRIKQIIAEKLQLDESRLTDSTSLVRDLEADSLEQSDIIFTIEDEYNLTPEYSFTPPARIGPLIGYFMGQIEKQKHQN